MYMYIYVYVYIMFYLDICVYICEHTYITYACTSAHTYTVHIQLEKNLRSRYMSKCTEHSGKARDVCMYLS